MLGQQTEFQLPLQQNFGSQRNRTAGNYNIAAAFEPTCDEQQRRAGGSGGIGRSSSTGLLSDVLVDRSTVAWATAPSPQSALNFARCLRRPFAVGARARLAVPSSGSRGALGKGARSAPPFPRLHVRFCPTRRLGCAMASPRGCFGRRGAVDCFGRHGAVDSRGGSVAVSVRGLRRPRSAVCASTAWLHDSVDCAIGSGGAGLNRRRSLAKPRCCVGGLGGSAAIFAPRIGRRAARATSRRGVAACMAREPATSKVYRPEARRGLRRWSFGGVACQRTWRSCPTVLPSTEDVLQGAGGGTSAAMPREDIGEVTKWAAPKIAPKIAQDTAPFF